MYVCVRIFQYFFRSSTTADKQSVFLFNCVLRSQSFVFCFVA